MHMEKDTSKQGFLQDQTCWFTNLRKIPAPLEETVLMFWLCSWPDMNQFELPCAQDSSKSGGMGPGAFPYSHHLSPNSFVTLYIQPTLPFPSNPNPKPTFSAMPLAHYYQSTGTDHANEQNASSSLSPSPSPLSAVPTALLNNNVTCVPCSFMVLYKQTTTTVFQVSSSVLLTCSGLKEGKLAEWAFH